MKPVSMWVVLGMSLLLVTGAMAQPPVKPGIFLDGELEPVETAMRTAIQPKPQNGTPTSTGTRNATDATSRPTTPTTPTVNISNNSLPPLMDIMTPFGYMAPRSKEMDIL